jgi:hypothetical protein
MSTDLLDTLARDGFEEMHALHDGQSGARAFLVFDDTGGGPSFGGDPALELHRRSRPCATACAWRAA